MFRFKVLLESCTIYFTYFDFQFHCAEQWHKIAMLCCEQKVCSVNIFPLAEAATKTKTQSRHSTGQTQHFPTQVRN